MDSQVLVPILTLIAGQFLGYWFAVRQIKRRVAAEKRVEYVTRFVAEAYQNLGHLLPGNAQALEEGRAKMAAFSVLGQQAAFFVSDSAAKSIDELTSNFASAILNLSAPLQGIPLPGPPKDVWGEYRAKLETLRGALRKELQAHK